MGVYGTSKLPKILEMISKMIYIVALGNGFKCPRKIYLNAQWEPASAAVSHVSNYRTY